MGYTLWRSKVVKAPSLLLKETHKWIELETQDQYMLNNKIFNVERRVPEGSKKFWRLVRKLRAWGLNCVLGTKAVGRAKREDRAGRPEVGRGQRLLPAPAQRATFLWGGRRGAWLGFPSVRGEALGRRPAFAAFCVVCRAQAAGGWASSVSG